MLLSEKPRNSRARVLHSMLSGPIDVDKMDYLSRDSLHAGVPYGQNFDQQRLIGSLCLSRAGDGLAISDKGRTAAEMLVFARYVMFSEVYWHHAVRAATAMLQRAFFLLYTDLDLDKLFRLTEQAMIDQLLDAAGTSPSGDLLRAIFGPTRQLYKRVIEYSYTQHKELYGMLARRPYPWLVACADAFSNILSRELRRRIAPHEVLFDAPPVKLEIQFNIEIHFPKESSYRPLGEVSPVVNTLARQQFDDYVKRVRIFAHPDLVSNIRALENLNELVEEAVARLDS